MPDVERRTAEELDAEIESAKRECKTAKQRLRRLLADGSDTQAAHQAIEALLTRIEDLIKERAALGATMDRQRAEARGRLAQLLCDEINQRLSDRMAELQPPTQPAQPEPR